MRIMFLHSGDRVPSSRFRVLPYIPRLRAMGHVCRVAGSFPQKYDYISWLGFRPSQMLKRLVRRVHLLEARFRRYDVIVIDRELFDDPSVCFERRFRRAAPALVLDLDDAVFLRFPQKFEQLAQLCDFFIVGNRLLEEKFRPLNSNLAVIPTCVELDDYPQKGAASPTGSQVVIGWIGTTGNLEYLQVAAPALRNLAQRAKFELRVIASDEGPLRTIDLSGVEVRFVRWQGATEVTELGRFDVGIMPLFSDREWDKYKCGLKLIQYMAIGIPAVASPVGVNADIVTHGVNGFLAHHAEDWESLLLQLINDASLRERIGDAARQTVKEHYSIEANIPRLIAALETARQVGASRIS